MSKWPSSPPSHQPAQTCCSNGDAVDHVAISQGHGDPICKPSFGIAASLSPCVFCSGLHSKSEKRGNITVSWKLVTPEDAVHYINRNNLNILGSRSAIRKTIWYFHPRMPQASSRRGLGHDHAIGQFIHGPNFAPDKYRLRRC